MDPVFGALTHHGPLDDGIAAVNGECDAGLVEDQVLFAFNQRDRVSGFVKDDALPTGQRRVGGGSDGQGATDPLLIDHFHLISPPH